MDKFKILIIGGTRFFGMDIVNLLLKDGHQVVILSNVKKAPKFIGNCVVFKGDRRDGSFLKKIAGRNKFDFILDNIASAGKDVEDCLSIFKGRAGHYILTSTAWVYKILDSPGRPFLEEDLIIREFKKQPRRIREATFNYIKGKIDCEAVLMSQSGIKYTIFRPCMITGPNDHNLRGYFYFQRLMDKGKIIFFKKSNPFQLAYKDDVAKIYQKAIESPGSINQVFNLAPAETISVQKFIEISARSLNIEPNFCILPKNKVETVIPGYSENEPFNFEKDIYDSEKIKKILKISFTPYEKWIKDTAVWYRDKYSGKDSLGYDKRNKEINLCN